MVRLSQIQWNALSEILRDVGQIFFASAIIEPIVAGSATWVVFFSGVTLALVSWSLSIYLTKKA